MKLVPKKREDISSATITQALGLILICSVVFVLTAYASPPAWWSSRGAVAAPVVTTNDGVVTTNYVPNDYAVVTQGQLKQFTVKAVDELNADLTNYGGAGTSLTNLTHGWQQDYATNGYNATNIKPSDFTVMNVGQLKSVAGLVYGRLSAVGYTELTPSWLHQNTNTDYQTANLGQLKQLFDFDLSLPGASGLTATAGTSGAVNLTWSLPSTNSVTSWLVEQQNTNGTWNVVADLTNSATTSYTVTGLTNGDSYNFQIIAAGTNSVSLPASVSATVSSSSIPTDGLTLWLKADAGVTTDGSGNISQWQDQSPNAYVAGQTNSTAYPTLATNVYNGQPAVRFNGSSQFLQIPSISDNYSPGMTVFAVFNPTADASWERIYDFGNGAGVNNLILARYSTSYQLDFQTYHLGYSQWDNGYSDMVDSDLQEYTVVNDPSTMVSMYRNGNPTVTYGGSPTDNATRTSNFIGKSNWSQDALFQGDIEELIIYNRPLTSTERQGVELYLALKYDLPILGPVITPPGGLFVSSEDVSIQSYSSPVVVRYTLDGSSPSSSSVAYTGDFTVTNDCAVTAANFVDDAKVSADVSVQFYLDSDNNGLPDSWELEYFGAIGNDPDSSPDGNGLTLLQDYDQGNNPTNYYSQNGTIIVPTVVIADGDNQWSLPGAFAPDPMTVAITDEYGNPLNNAPVTFNVTEGGGLLATTSGGAGTSSLQVVTDSNGLAEIYYRQPSGDGVAGQIIASTGGQSVAFSERSSSTIAPPSLNPPAGTYDLPTNVKITSYTSGVTIYYSLDGSTPTTSSPSIVSGGTVLVAQSETLNILASAPGYSTDSEASAAYIIGSPLSNSIPITNLVLWLRADANVATDDYGDVISIQDLANGFLLNQIGEGGEPSFIADDLNGEPGLRFNGEQSLYSSEGFGPALNSDMTIITVGMSLADSSYGETSALYLGQYVNTGQDRAFAHNGGDDLFDAGFLYCDGGPAPASAGFDVEMVTLDSSLTQVAFYQNGSQTGSGTLPTGTLQNTAPGITIGSIPGYGWYQGWYGDILEQLVYSRKLSAGELWQVELYLAAKYNLPIQAPPPTITPDGGSFSTSTTVTLSSEAAPAIIRYTLDGTSPTVASPEYTSPLTLSESLPINAALFLDGVQISSVASAQFYVDDSADIGISDSWQLAYFGHVGIDPNVMSPGGSGLTNLQDYLLGYDPTKYSTNGDGLSDLVNYSLGYSGSDTDINGYGLTNAQQLALGLDPFDTGLNPSLPTPPTSDPTDHTAPVITLTSPDGATLSP